MECRGDCTGISLPFAFFRRAVGAVSPALTAFNLFIPVQTEVMSKSIRLYSEKSAILISLTDNIEILSKLEAIMRRIFEQVEKEPASAEDLHKFMDYYLPTTTKLLQACVLPGRCGPQDFSCAPG